MNKIFLLCLSLICTAISVEKGVTAEKSGKSPSDNDKDRITWGNDVSSKELDKPDAFTSDDMHSHPVRPHQADKSGAHDLAHPHPGKPGTHHEGDHAGMPEGR